jgi:hypothetical protein
MPDFYLTWASSQARPAGAGSLRFWTCVCVARQCKQGNILQHTPVATWHSILQPFSLWPHGIQYCGMHVLHARQRERNCRG